MRYRLNDHLLHDGAHHDKGSVIDLSDAQASRLPAWVVTSLDEPASAPIDPPPAPENPEPAEQPAPDAPQPAAEPAPAAPRTRARGKH